jgi:hypothetical protein
VAPNGHASGRDLGALAALAQSRSVAAALARRRDGDREDCQARQQHRNPLAGTMLKRAATAIREARSNDTIMPAKAALSAAIRSEIDFLELLPDLPAKPAALKPSAKAIPSAGALELSV